MTCTSLQKQAKRDSKVIEKWSKMEPKTVQNGSLERIDLLFFFEDRVWHQHGPKWLHFDLQFDPQNRWKIDVVFDAFFGTLPKWYSHHFCTKNDLQSGPILEPILNVATMRFCCYLLYFGTILTFQRASIFNNFLEGLQNRLQSWKKPILHRFGGLFLEHFSTLFPSKKTHTLFDLKKPNF